MHFNAYTILNDKTKQLDDVMSMEKWYVDRLKKRVIENDPVQDAQEYVLPDVKLDTARPPVPEGFDSDEIVPDYFFVDAKCPYDGLFRKIATVS